MGADDDEVGIVGSSHAADDVRRCPQFDLQTIAQLAGNRGIHSVEPETSGSHQRNRGERHRHTGATERRHLGLRANHAKKADLAMLLARKLDGRAQHNLGLIAAVERDEDALHLVTLHLVTRTSTRRASRLYTRHRLPSAARSMNHSRAMKSILAALDGSPESSEVVVHALELARAVGARVTLTHVIPPTEVSGTNENFDRSRAFLEKLEVTMPPSMRGGCEVRFGLPAPTICQTAASKNVDCIVIGAHHHGPVERALGTTAAEVVNESDRPVLVVRCKEESAEHVAEDVTRIEDASSNFQRAADILRSEHAHLEVVYEELLRAYRRGDWNEVDTQWPRFESTLRTHMDHEERDVFPSFRLIAPEEADVLTDEHRTLRRLLSTLGVAIQIHAFPMQDAEELIRRLRDHEAREARLLYPFVDLSFDALAFGARIAD